MGRCLLVASNPACLEGLTICAATPGSASLRCEWCALYGSTGSVGQSEEGRLRSVLAQAIGAVIGKVSIDHESHNHQCRRVRLRVRRSAARQFIHSLLPNDHLDSDTKEAVRLGMALVGTIVALVLGLLIGSGKGFYDTQNSEVTQLAADVVLLDRVLVHYGPETKRST